MNILCAIEHKPVESRIWRNGYYFSRCRRCQCVFVRKDESWQAPPVKIAKAWRPWAGTEQPPSADFLTSLVENWGYCDAACKTVSAAPCGEGAITIDMPAAR